MARSILDHWFLGGNFELRPPMSDGLHLFEPQIFLGKIGVIIPASRICCEAEEDDCKLCKLECQPPVTEHYLRRNNRGGSGWSERGGRRRLR